MKHHNPHIRAPRPSPLGVLSALLTATLAFAAPARAADWYLRLSQPFASNWHTAGEWNTTPNGSGSNAASISAADTYHINNYNLRTPYTTGPVTFDGGLLRLSGGTSAIGIKTSGVGGATIPNLASEGGKIENAEGGTVYLNVTNFNVVSGSTALTSVSGRATKLSVGTLSGSGELLVSGAGSTALLSVTQASAFTGSVRLASGTLNFDADLVSSGPLVIDGGTLVLDQAVTVTSLKIGATTYAAGTYDYAALASTGRLSPTSTGTITVNPATTWYLKPANQPNPNHWKTLADWSSTADGTGPSPTEFRAADTFDTNGKQVLRTPFVNTQVPENNFTGGQLRLTSSATTLALKGYSNVPLAVLPSLYATNGKINQNANASIRLRIDHLENQATGVSGLTLNSISGTNAGIDLSIGKLIGSGILRFSGTGARFRLSADDATTYTGDIYLAFGKLDFDNSLSSAGRLVIDAAGFVELDQVATFTELIIAGTEYPIGNYPLATLQANHPGMFTGVSGGAIVVRGPVDWYLTNSQTSATDSWNTRLHWNSATDGSGAVPPTINPIDNFINQVADRTVRTPDATSTFAGGALVLKSGGKLMLRAPAGATSTVPTFVTEGTATIYNGYVGIAQTLALDTWNVSSGATVLTTTTGGAGGSLDLRVHHLKGAGDIIVGGNSIVRPVINHGGQYTGTFTVNTGATLTINETFGIGGGLVINSGATVTLNKWAYVTALTVNGVAQPLGTHTAASLGLAGAGSVVVYSATTPGPVQLFGVNFAGAEFGGTAFWQTNAAMWDYYQAKGLTLIRMPVKWSRIQTTLNGTVNFTQMDQCIALAAARGMKVIIDIHDYAAYAGGSTPPRLGSAGLPISAFTNVWSQIADHYKNNTAVYGYDLMNEPVGITIAVWADAAQQAVDAIRQKDPNHYVLVEGLGYSSSEHWRIGSDNGSLDIKDPVGRLIYSAHSYWDYQMNAFASPPFYGNDGNYRSNDLPTPLIGVNDVKPFVTWLKTRPYAYGNIGEFAVPNDYNSAGWNEALGNFLQYLRDNNIGGTYWAAGNNWVLSPTVCHPQPFPGTDKPQMSVLQLFNNL